MSNVINLFKPKELPYRVDMFFNPTYAVLIGVDGSIMLSYLHEVCLLKEVAIYENGSWWFCITKEALYEHFFFWTRSKITWVIGDLERRGLIKTLNSKKYKGAKCFQVTNAGWSL